MYDDGRIRVLWDATLCSTPRCACYDCRRSSTSGFRPWVDLAGAAPEEIAATIRACSKGALRYGGEEVAEERPDDPTTIETAVSLLVQRLQALVDDVRGRARVMPDVREVPMLAELADGLEVPDRRLLHDVADPAEPGRAPA